MGAKRTLIAAVLFMVFAGTAFAGAADIPEGARCHLCGMVVQPSSAYSAQIVDGGQLLAFCDIGDMLYHYNKQAAKPAELYVRDMKSMEWTDAKAALYVKSEKFSTPMGWGIAAFKDREEAARHGAPMSFEEALGSLGEMKMKHKMH